MRDLIEYKSAATQQCVQTLGDILKSVAQCKENMAQAVSQAQANWNCDSATSILGTIKNDHIDKQVQQMMESIKTLSQHLMGSDENYEDTEKEIGGLLKSVESLFD